MHVRTRKMAQQHKPRQSQAQRTHLETQYVKEATRPRKERDQVEHRDGTHDPPHAGETKQTLQPLGPEPLQNLTKRVAITEAPVTLVMPMAIVAIVAVIAVCCS